MGEPEDGLVDRRIDGLLAVAREVGVSVPMAEIAELLPVHVKFEPDDIARWLVAHPDAGHLVGDRVVPAPVKDWDDWAERRERGRRFLAEAESLVDGPLAPVRGLIRCVAVTGSVAYGEPASGDDLDLFLVTREGAVWPVLLWAFLAGRRRSTPGAGAAAHWCFNSVLEESAATELFGRSRDFLFAREALTARPVWGEAFYRSLVGRSGWMRGEIPRLYQLWAEDGLAPVPSSPPAATAVRVVNLLLWPWVGAYLVGKALVHNHALRRQGRADRKFRVVAERRRMELRTERFETLRRLYSMADPAGAA